MMLPTDEELVVRCKRELPRSTRSYEMLVQRHMQHVYATVYQVVGNKEEAEDVAQDVFVKVYNGIKKFDQRASFSSWLYRVSTNSALDALDKIKRQRNATFTTNGKRAQDGQDESDILNLQPSPAAGPEESILQEELKSCIYRVLSTLEHEQARLILLRDFHDLSYDEISKALGAGLSAVKMRIHRARLAFQDLFNQL
ncbi:MAG TPA: sigma-70 family RNA polymerase sigma factor, partial [Ktedonobacteraceae bacterium]|nr:sigma-70 family RNA polymerase sigma factor [Ktedonobacteraceae bacterium]